MYGVEDYYRKSASEVLKILDVDAGNGLGSEEVDRRKKEYGSNTLPSPPKYRFILQFFSRFKDTLVIILLLSAGVSLVLGHVSDAIIIGVALILDASLSFLQTWRTEKTLNKMRQRLQDVTSVVRNATSQTILSSELVVGDVIEFRAGDKVPADARIISTSGVRAQESILTGESGDVSKDPRSIQTRTPMTSRINMVYAGTTIMSGSGMAVVTAVGTQTEFGKLALVIREQKSPASPLQKMLRRKGAQIGWLIIAAVGLLMGVGILRGDSVLETGRVAITLVVSAIPEDMAMILTIVLTVGVARLLKKGGIVRKLSSGETLGSATVICTDKTGTLTEGSMKAIELNFLQGDIVHAHSTVTEPYQEIALKGFVLANDAHKVGTGKQVYVGAATERTALEFVEGIGLEQDELKKEWTLRDSIVFDSTWKYRAVLVDHPTQSAKWLFVSGAPDVLIEKSSHALNKESEPELLDSARRHEISSQFNELASDGRRIIAVAVRRHLIQSEIVHDDVRDLLFLGVLIIEDPVREDVKESIEEAQSAGVDVKIITGDHTATAIAVANRVGLTVERGDVVSGTELQGMSDEELSQYIEEVKIFSRIEPLDKQRIIRILQDNGNVVAMTGDGVNDTVALRSADIGVAMGSGTDIAKDAADLVLLNNSFSTFLG